MSDRPRASGNRRASDDARRRRAPEGRRDEAYDPPPYGLGLTARRLFGLWREERKLSLIGIGYATAYSGLSLAIPALVARQTPG